MPCMQNNNTCISTILIVDDNPVNNKLLKAVLESRSYAVRIASSGAQALQEIEESIPDLVMLDVMMPEMTGYEVCQIIRRNPKTRSLPIVMLTALDHVLEKVKGIEAGADDFLSKPINQAELFARIQSLLRISNIRKELENNLLHLENQVQYDPLTQCFSRTEIMQRLSIEIDRSQRNKYPCALLALDIDHFKSINDLYGHQAGDEVLINLVRQIKKMLRSIDSVGRIGGEEFLILLPDTTIEAATDIAERLRAAIAKTIHLTSSSTPIQITVSIGIAILNLSHHPDTTRDEFLNELVNQADMSMYTAKKNGRNQIATFYECANQEKIHYEQ